MKSELEQLRCGYEKQGFDHIKQTLGPHAFRSLRKTRGLLEDRRRQLLGDSVRVTRALLPEIYDRYQQCLDRVGGDLSGDLYIQQSPVYNAHVLGVDGRFDLVVHSSLLNDFTLDELTFVIGHEVGHVLFGHSAFSVHEYLQTNTGTVDAQTAGLLFRWSRAAEISADRVGLLCCGSLSTAASALFKTSSGVAGVSVDRILASFRAQYDELVSHIQSVGAGYDWVRTHPMIPIRFKAIELVALDMVALRKGGNIFSWNGFRQVDQTIADLLERLDVETDAQRGLFSEDGSLCTVTALLYLSLAAAESVGWRERAFIHDAHRKVRCEAPLNDMVDTVNRNPGAFRSSFADEIARTSEGLRARDVRTIVEIAALMLVTCEAVGERSRAQLSRVAELLGSDPSEAQTILSQFQSNRPSLEDLL